MAGFDFDIRGDNSNFLRKLEETRNGVRTTSKQIEDSGMSIEDMFGRIAKGAAAIGAGFSVKEFVTKVAQVRGEFQQLEVAFKTMLGSEERANTLMQQLVKTAATTPFDLQSVANGAKQLLAYGDNVENVNEDLVRLGNIAAGLSQPLGDIVYLYGTTMTQGRLYTQDFNQFTGRGIPMIKELAKQFGVAESQVRGLVESGKVGFPEVQKVIQSLTNEGGMFFNLMQEQSKTITGQISNIEDSISTMFNNIGKQSEGVINDALSGVSYLVENYEEVGKSIMEVVVAYGAYKGVLMSIAAYQGAVTGMSYAAEIAELQKLLPLKQQSANEDVIASVASGKLTQSKAEQIIALRAEVNAKITSLQATKAQADVELSSALASYKASRLRFTVAQEQMAIAQSQMAIAVKSGTAAEIELARVNAQTASTELNSAAIDKNNARKAANIAATNSKSASETLNTYQTSANTVAQNTNTTSTNVLTIAKARLAAASKALGLSMLANPYVLVTAAIAGLGYVIYKTVIAETELEKAHKRLEEVTSGVEKNLASEVSKLTSLERKLSEAKKGTEEYNNIKKTIVDNYGRYYEGLDGEIERVGNLSTTYAQLVKNIRLSIGQRKFESFFKAEQDNLDKTIGDKLDKAYNTLIDKYGKGKGLNLYNQFFDSAMRGNPLSPDVIKDLEKATFFEMKWGDNAQDGTVDFENSVMNLRSEISKETKATEKVLDECKELYQLTEEDLKNMFSGNPSGGNNTPTENKTLLKLISDIEAAKFKIKDLQEQANKGLISPDKIKEEQDSLSKLTAEYKSRTDKEYGSKADNTLRSEQSDRLRAIDEYRKSMSEAGAQAELEIRQQGIEAMEEGSRKALAQINLDYDRRMDANRKRADGMIKERQELERKQWEYDNPKWKEKGMEFKPSTTSVEQLSKAQQDQILSYDKLTLDARKKAEDDHQKTLMEKYQDYTDKRLAIEKKYNDDLATLRSERRKAEKDGDTGKVEKLDRAIAQGTKDKGKDLMGLDYEQLKQSPDYVRAFENLKHTSSETLNSLLSQLESAKRRAAQVLSPDQLREYTSTIQSIMDELEERNPFQSLADRKQELAEAEEELALAKQQLDAVNGGAKIQTGVKIVKNNKETGTIESEKTYLSASEAAEIYIKAQNKVVKNSNQVKTAEKKVTDVISELSQSVSDVGNSVGGLTGEIISMIGGIGITVMGAIQGLSSVSKTASIAIQTVEKASVILAIISAAVQIATKMFDLFGADTTTEKYEEAKEAYESYINILDKVIEKQLELAETLTGDNANAAYDKAIELTKLKSENAKVLGKQYLNSGASWKSHSKGYEEVDDMSWEGWDQAARALGMTIDQLKGKMGGRMTGLFDLTDEQLVKLQTDAGIFWSQLDSDTQKYADQIVNGIAGVADIMEQKMSDVTLIDLDDLRSDFEDLLADMDSDSADFAGNFEEYMKNAIINSMLKESYMGRLEAWRKKFYAAMDGGMTEYEYRDLKADGTKISEDMKADRDKWADMFGWAWEESRSQDSTKKGFESMSQDTGNELSGRFSAMLVSSEGIRISMLSMLASMNLVAVSVYNNGTTLIEIRNLMISSNGYLEDISGHTKKILDTFGARLDSIDKNIKNAL